VISAQFISLYSRNHFLLANYKNEGEAAIEETTLLRNARDKLLEERREMRARITRLEEELSLLRDSILIDSDRLPSTGSIKGGLIVANRTALASDSTHHRNGSKTPVRPGVQPSASFPNPNSISLPRHSGTRSKIDEPPTRGSAYRGSAAELLLPSGSQPNHNKLKHQVESSRADAKKIGDPLLSLAKRSSSLPIRDLPEANTTSVNATATKSPNGYNSRSLNPPITPRTTTKSNTHVRVNGVPSMLVKKMPFLSSRKKE